MLLEVFTFLNGKYGRFLVLVCLGIGCTVWFGFEPGVAVKAPEKVGVFTLLDSYDPFMDMDRQTFKSVEQNDTSESVKSAFQNELPFAEINIPGNGEMLTAMSLGMMVAIFLAVGIVPNLSGDPTILFVVGLSG